MLTADIRSQIDRVWDAFWAGGISNPLEVIEQITYLLFMKRLDELHTLAENKARADGKPMERRIFGDGPAKSGRPFDALRWSRFKNFAPAEMYEVVEKHVFPFLRTLGGEGSTYATHMRLGPLHHPHPRPAGQGGGHDRPRADAGPRHQGRPLRVHARQDRPGRARTASSARRATSFGSWSR